jgi:hypothetical protein
MTDKTHVPDKGIPGVPVDTYGGPTVDPTKNVLDLVGAAVTRLDDLRIADSRRVDELRALERDHAQDIRVLIANYEEKLRVAEANRIDAIRAVDVGAVATAAERQNQAAVVLANQVALTADTLRTLVTTQATTTAQQLQQVISPISENISKLQQAQYEGAGRAVVMDPQTAQLAVKMEALATAMAEGVGAQRGSVDTRSEQRQSSSAIWIAVAGVVGVLGLGAVAITILISIVGLFVATR